MKKQVIWMVMVLCIFGGISYGDLFEGLLGYWPLDESDGLVAGDVVGGNDGVLEDNVNWVTGQLGSAMETNGGSQAIFLPSNPVFETPNMSFSCWAITKAEGWGNWEGIVGICYDSGSRESGWALYEYGAVGTVEFYASQAGTMVTLAVSGVPMEVWNHWAGTVSDTDITIYLNGQMIVSLPFAGGVDYTETHEDGWDITPTIGTYYDDNENNYFNGSVDDVAIWDRALTDGEVAALYNGGAGFALPIAIPVAPASGESFVATDTILEWAAPNGRVVSAFDVWFGTDPNSANPNADFAKIVDHKDLTTVDPSPAGDLTPDTEYFWRVDMYEPNSLGTGEDVSDGMVWNFRTAPDAPVILTQPVSMIIGAGETAEFVSGGSNIQTYTWYVSQDAVNNTPADDVVVEDDSFMLSIPDVQLADEGYYYCVGLNGGLTDVSDVASLLIERLIHHYPLDGESADDVVGGVNGTVVGDPVWIDGISGGAIDMLPASMSELEDWIVLGEPGDITYGTDDFTVSFWMKTPSLTGDPALMSNKDWDSGSNTGWVIAWGGAGDGIYQWNFDTGSPDRNDYDPTGPETADDQWHLVTISHDRQGMATFYIDGDVRGQSDISRHAGNSMDAGLPTVIGNDGLENYHEKWGEHTRCAFDDVRIYNYALDTVEVATLYTDLVTDAVICAVRPALDVNENCRVDLGDLAVFAQAWLECGRIPVEACDQQ